MANLYDSVREFHEKFGHPVGKRADLPSDGKFYNRLKWLHEEIQELRDAYTDANRIEFADALGDAIYIIVGWAVECNIPIDEVFDAIHKSNMSKLGSDGKPITRWDGKIGKGPNFKPPTDDIRRLLNATPKPEGPRGASSLLGQGS